MNTRRDWLAPEFVPGLVSVIVPSRNRAAFLSAALESVAAQRYRPVEIQLVDDGSTDNTRDVVAAFVECHSGDKALSLQYHRRDHAGASAARNHGLEQCRGEFIQFLDSDDLLHPDKLSTQVRAITAHGADFVWSSTVAYRDRPDWNAAPLVGAAMEGNSGLDFIKPFIKKSCWRTESGLHRRSNCAKIGAWRSLTMFQDWEYHIRMLAGNPRVHFATGNFAAANQHDRGRIGDKWLDGSGLDGALEAIRLVEVQTRPQFQHDPRWRQLLKTRYIEVAERAERLGLPDVASRAREISCSGVREHADAGAGE